ncbi:MAG: efflux RND transporter permease subunit, partial [Steroidobacteraceae bacterium]
AAALTPSSAAALRRFAGGTPLFRRAGLLGDHFLGIALTLDTPTAAERDRVLAAIDAASAPLAGGGGPFTAVRRVGEPWINAWLEHASSTAQLRFMPLFGLFLMALIFLLYRSWRTLAAMVLTLASTVAIGIGLAALFGWAHTMVSALVPLTILVTTTATLVYIHSRYIERGDSATLLEHHARVLANKLVPCSASIFATAVGFAALAVSDIQPIREMGLWTASGLAVAWVGSFTLFPALESLLRTPLRAERAPAGHWFPDFVDRWVPITDRYRWPLVIIVALLTLCGAAALFGIPGELAPLPLETDSLAYVNPHAEIARDTRAFERHSGLAVFELWLTTPAGTALSPEHLRGIERLTHALEADPRITAVESPTSVLRWTRYLETGDDRLPSDAAAWPGLASQLRQTLARDPGAREYVDWATLSNVRISIRGRDTAFVGTGAMRAYIERTFQAVQRTDPAMRDVRGRVVGQSVLAEKITLELVPTLIRSFALTAGVIFCVFLLVFRSASARLMAMIPSLFAILAAFLVMRGGGIALNVATILIGSTVLGATENDQVHFFYHFQEGRAQGTTAAALRHAMLVAGRPIAFATLINVAGFLALALSDLPPMRQFGIVTAAAFLLALAADFTALPAALWILARSRRAPATGLEPI